MTSLTWPDHLLTLDEWDVLPGDHGSRLEVVEGVLLVVPRPTVLHQRAVVRLAALLDRVLPEELCALAEVEVLIDGGAGSGAPATVRAPDVVVAPSAVVATNPARLDAGSVLVAVEVLSPGTVRTDRVTKMAEYADAGIAGYWLVDIDPPATLTAFALVDGCYELVAETTGRVDLLSPVPVHLDVAGLLAR